MLAFTIALLCLSIPFRLLRALADVPPLIGLAAGVHAPSSV
jgi:hypothetical protein